MLHRDQLQYIVVYLAGLFAAVAAGFYVARPHADGRGKREVIYPQHKVRVKAVPAVLPLGQTRTSCRNVPMQMTVRWLVGGRWDAPGERG